MKGHVTMTDEEILEQYRKTPFIRHIMKMGVGIARVRRVVREAEKVGATS